MSVSRVSSIGINYSLGDECKGECIRWIDGYYFGKVRLRYICV